MRVQHIEVHLDDGQVATMDFGPYGWNQWGAREATLWETMAIAEALEEASMKNDELATFLYGDDDEGEL